MDNLNVLLGHFFSQFDLILMSEKNINGEKKHFAKGNTYSNDPHLGLDRYENYGITAHPPKGSRGLSFFPFSDRNYGIVISLDDFQNKPSVNNEGEVKYYSVFGSYIHLKNNGDIDIYSPNAVNFKSKNISMEADNININCKNIDIKASTSTKIESKNFTINCETSFNVNSPVSNFSKTVNAPTFNGSFGGPSGGSEVEMKGNLNCRGEVKDSKGSLDQLRSDYKKHTHKGYSGSTTSTPN